MTTRALNRRGPSDSSRLATSPFLTHFLHAAIMVVPSAGSPSVAGSGAGIMSQPARRCQGVFGGGLIREGRAQVVVSPGGVDEPGRGVRRQLDPSAARADGERALSPGRAETEL